MVTARVRGWRFGVFEADLELHELRKRGIHIKLAGQPFQALTILLQRPGSVVPREELRNALWPDEPWGDHDQGLNKAINKIRDALNDSADTPRLIETIPRVGYRFLVPVTPLMDQDAETEAPPSVQWQTELTQPLPAAVPILLPAPPAKFLHRSNSTWLAVLIVLLAAGIWVIERGTHRALAKQNQTGLTAQAQPLTTYVGSEQYPAFSPHGKLIAFAWDGASQTNSHIFTIESNGSGLRQVTKGPSSDSAPAWSPDSSQLAFVRDSSGLSKELWICSADGSQARKLADFGRISHDDSPVTWTKDPHFLIAALRAEGEGPAALYLVSAESGEKRRITSPPLQSAGDLSPSLSVDGQRVAFTRGATVARSDIFLLNLTAELSPAAEPRRITDLNRVIDTIAWKSAGQLYFTASPTPSGARHIFSVGTGSESPNQNVMETGIEGVHPALSPDGNTLCYVRSNIEQSSIWRVDFPADNRAPHRERLLSSTRRDYTADLSPDGKRLLFSSVRSGTSEIWVSDVDGTNLRQITLKGASTPRWAPDGERIAYESSVSGQPDIYVFDLNTNKELRLTKDAAADLRPSWSRDGASVYFSSTRSGRAQIWKVPSRGGPETQITRDGGVYAVESFDKKSIYFTSADHVASIRTAPSSGGPEKTLLAGVVGHSAVSLAPGGLYYLSSQSRTGGQIAYFNLATNSSRPFLAIDRPIHHFLSSSANGNFVLFTQVDQQDSDLMLLPLN